MRARLWPTGLIGRVGLVLFLTVAVELVGSTALFQQAEILLDNQTEAQRIVDGVDAAARVLMLTLVANRPTVAATLSEKDMELHWSERAAPVAAGDARSDALRDRIVALEPRLSALRLAPASDGVRGAIALADGSQLAFHVVTRRSVPSYVTQIWSIGLLSGGVFLAALLVVRTMAAPLRMLVAATDRIGHGPGVTLYETGPREVRRVARAFNAMQERITKLIADRTQALAAVSHDLRTPIGRLKLRAGFLPEGEDRAAFESDLGEMEAMLADLFAYLGGDADPEKARRVDVAALLATLVDDAADAGHDAVYAGPVHLAIEARALALKRALSNVINNAIAYGDRARVVLRDEGSRLVVVVEDSGPGIPEVEMANVVQPFVRGDASRNRAKGGMGLGLSITKQVVSREGGRLNLENRTEGGLRVTIALPRR